MRFFENFIHKKYQSFFRTGIRGFRSKYSYMAKATKNTIIPPFNIKHLINSMGSFLMFLAASIIVARLNTTIAIVIAVAHRGLDKANMMATKVIINASMNFPPVFFLSELCKLIIPY